MIHQHASFITLYSKRCCRGHSRPVLATARNTSTFLFYSPAPSAPLTWPALTDLDDGGHLDFLRVLLKHVGVGGASVPLNVQPDGGA